MDSWNRAARALAPLAAGAALLAGCGSVAKTSAGSGAAASTAGAKKHMAGINMSGSSSSMPGMNMGGSGSAGAAGAGAAGTKAVTVGGITAIPTQTLGSTTWQGMQITAMAMTAVPFDVDDGTSVREVKPTKHTSFHLMVMLNDAVTHVPIPYATVWATISEHSRVIFDERQWPMISRYMGPHYGNDVTVPAAGSYQLSLLVSPPVSARHMEYANVWLKPHRVDFTFHWTPPGS
jgi:uncharacterized protein involved in high-affinity Fe2+ transport